MNVEQEILDIKKRLSDLEKQNSLSAKELAEEVSSRIKRRAEPENDIPLTAKD